jgi:hypothetical protein
LSCCSCCCCCCCCRQRVDVVVVVGCGGSRKRITITYNHSQQRQKYVVSKASTNNQSATKHTYWPIHSTRVQVETLRAALALAKGRHPQSRQDQLLISGKRIRLRNYEELPRVKKLREEGAHVDCNLVGLFLKLCCGRSRLLGFLNCLRS